MRNSFDNNHHAYYINDKKVIKFNRDNIDDIFNESFGKNVDDGYKKRYVISKTPIKEYE